jgi:hypothetical protein
VAATVTTIPPGHVPQLTGPDLARLAGLPADELPCAAATCP